MEIAVLILLGLAALNCDAFVVRMARHLAVKFHPRKKIAHHRRHA